eukprot:6683898-Prymnesium_polylepis.1
MSLGLAILTGCAFFGQLWFIPNQRLGVLSLTIVRMLVNDVARFLMLFLVVVYTFCALTPLDPPSSGLWLLTLNPTTCEPRPALAPTFFVSWPPTKSSEHRVHPTLASQTPSCTRSTRAPARWRCRRRCRSTDGATGSRRWSTLASLAMGSS